MLLLLHLLLLHLLLLHLLPPEGSTSSVSCYNDQGDAVDWFYIYKLPEQRGRQWRSDGLRYLLLESGGRGWVEGRRSINHSSGAAGRTLGQLYSLGQTPDAAFILYNDQPPEDRGNHGNGDGHTKGVLLLDSARGFWLVHSTPHFPPPLQAGGFSYPASGLNNGQSFLCITFPAERFQTVGEQLQINQPRVYDCSVPDRLAAVAPALAALCRKEPGAAPLGPPVKVSNRSVTLTSSGGSRFISFAKGASFDGDLYHGWVAPTLRSDLLVQFWIRSSGVRPSDCSQGWRVLNIRELQPGQAFRFKTSQDHSKWAVSPGGGGGGGGGWLCVGDINRDKAEERRGGGTVCLQDPVVWKAYRTAALDCQACGGNTTSCPSSTPPPGLRGP